MELYSKNKDIKVEKIAPLEKKGVYPLCTGGERAGPPEDCGGPWGYAELLRALNEEHAALRPTQTDLSSRISSYELAYRMQMAAPEALDVTLESEATHKL